MPFAHGKATEVLVGGVDVSPYLNSAAISVDVDTADTTAFKAPWKSAIAGVAGAKADFGGMYDPAELTLRNLLGLDTGVLTVSPQAGAIGAIARLLPIAATAYTESSPVGGVIGIKWSVLASAAAGIGWMLHPLAADVNTTTGADRDDGALSVSGWSAHLHVTAVTAGSWVVKLQDAATTDWLDVAGATFAAATGPVGLRLAGAPGSTLRRHVRYIATRTGGVAGDSITFALAYARN